MRISSLAVALLLMLGIPISFADSKPAPVDAYGQPLPDGAIARLGHLKFGMLGCPVAVAWSPDGTKLAAINNDKPRLVIWEWPSGKVLRDEKLSQASWGRLLFSPNGKYLVWSDGYPGRDEDCRLWDAEKGTQMAVPMEFRRQSRCVVFSSDSKRLALAPRNRAALEWVVGTDEVKTHRDTEARDHALHFTPKNELIVAASEPSSVTVRNVITRQESFKADVPDLFGRPMAISPDGEWFAYQLDRRNALVRQIGGKQEWVVPLDKADITAQLVFTPDSTALAVTMLGHMILLDLKSGKPRFDKRGHTLIEVAFSHDSKLFATFGGNHEHAVVVSDARNAEPVATSTGHFSPVWRAIWTPDGSEVVTWANMRGDPLVHFWEPRTGRHVRSWDASPHYGGVRWAPGGRFGVTDGGWNPERHLQIWDARTFKLVRSFTRLHPSTVGGFAISSDAERVVTFGIGTSPDDVMLRDFGTGKPLWKTPFTLPSVRAVEFLPGDEDILLVTEAGVQTIRVNEPASTLGRTILQVISPVAELSTDGKLLAATFSLPGRPIKTKSQVIEMATGREVVELGRDLAGNGVGFSHDARTCIVGTPEGALRLFDVPTGRELITLETGSGHGFSLSPDDRLLACPGGGIEAATPLVWDVERWTHRPRENVNAATPDEIARWCQLLADEDSGPAHRAVAGLAANPKRAVPAVRKVLGNFPKPDPARIARHIDHLADAKFASREEATRELTLLGSAARPVIEEALKGRVTAEQVRRLRAILAKITDPAASPESLFASRAVLVLEQIGTDEARQLLEAATKREPASPLNIEAKRALARMKSRP